MSTFTQHIAIEKMNIDTTIGNVENANQFLLQLTSTVKAQLLPALEDKLSTNLEAGDIQLDKIDVEVNISTKNGVWSADNEQELIQKTVETCLKSIQQKITHNTNSTHSLFHQLIHYFQHGWFSADKTASFEQLVTAWKQQPDYEKWNSELAKHVSKDRHTWQQFYKRTSASFLAYLTAHFIPNKIADFLLKIPALSQNGEKAKQTILQLGFSSATENTTAFFTLLKKEKRAADFLHIYTELEKKQPEYLKKYADEGKKWLKTLEVPNKEEIATFIQSKTSADLAKFIHFLRTNYSLSELLDPLLISYFNQQFFSSSLNDWIINFPKSIHRNTQLSGLINHLNSVDAKQPQHITNALHTFIENLTTQQTVRKKQTKKEDNSNQADQITIFNAGIVLLNPFLPALFKNLNLLDDKNNWQSQEKQYQAIYLLHLIATGYSKEDEAITEDQLLVGKLLTGYSFEEPLTPINPHTKELNELRNRYNTEQKDLLQALKTNWPVMKNCTWQGLQNDFLNRTGILDIKEASMQYILTVNSHALDVLLPHKKWGVAMVKYSWMEHVLNVVWEK